MNIPTHGDAPTRLAPQEGHTQPRASGPLARFMLEEARLMEIMVQARKAQIERGAGWQRLSDVTDKVLADLRGELPGKRARTHRNASCLGLAAGSTSRIKSP